MPGLPQAKPCWWMSSSLTPLLGYGTPNHTFWSRKVKQEKSEGAQSSPDWAPYRNDSGCYFKGLFNNVQQMTGWDYNTATSTLLGAFSSLLPPHSQLWYICIFPRQLCSKGSGASWELHKGRGQSMNPSPGVYLDSSRSNIFIVIQSRKIFWGKSELLWGLGGTTGTTLHVWGCSLWENTPLSQLSYL